MDSDLRRKFGRRVGELARLWRGAIDRELKPVGLSFMQWLTLYQLAESGTDLVQKELASRIGVEGPAMVATLDRLVRAGLVERRVSPHDRRANTVHLTVSGESALARAETALARVRERLLEGFDEEVLRPVEDVLETIIARARNT